MVRGRVLLASLIFVHVSIVVSHTQPAYAQVGVQILRRDYFVWTMRSIGGRLWVGTPNGAFSVTGDRVSRILDEDIFVWDIEEINGQVWIGTAKGVYRVENNVARRVGGEDLEVRNIKFIDGQIWLAAGDGVYRVEGDQIKRVPLAEGGAGQFRDIIKARDRIFFLTGTTLPNGSAPASSGPAFYMEGDAAYLFLSALPPEEMVTTWDIKEINGQIWFATGKGVYLDDGQSFRRVVGEEHDVRDIEKIGDQIWLATKKGVLRYEGGTAQPVFSSPINVRQIENINGDIWLLSARSFFNMPTEGLFPGPAYRVEGGDLRAFPAEGSSVWDIKEVGGAVWLATDSGAYQAAGDAVERTPNADLPVWSIEEVNNKVWLATSRGAFRVDKDVTIKASLTSDSKSASILGPILPKNVLIGGVVRPRFRYDLPGGGGPGAYILQKEFGVILETNEADFRRAVSNKQYSPAARFERSISSGRQSIYISVRDRWGNISEQVLTVWVIPGPAVWPILIGVLWLILLITIIALAPFSTFCHDLIMNHRLRSYGSFGLIPLALTMFPPLRRYILRRYTRSVRGDEAFIKCQEQFVPPTEEFHPGRFGKLLEKKRRLLLLGESGIGKTFYLTYIAGWYASKTGEKKRDALRGVVPVLIPLTKGRAVEDTFHAQLKNHGRLNDKELNISFLQQGGFLLLIDGLNEVDEPTRNNVITFVDENRNSNYICISSQHPYPRFEGIERVDAAYLSPDKIREVIRLRLDKGRAESAIKQFDESTYELYKVPLDLDFAIELLEKGHDLPKSKRGLYEATLAPILGSWIQKEHADYPAVLYRRAFEKLRSSDMSFEDADSPLPDEMRDLLLDKKFLYRSGDKILFRQDKIRAYLASRYLMTRWRELLSDEQLLIDDNWRPLLEFLISDLQRSEEVKELLEDVLSKNKRLAGELFTWVKSYDPTICRDWAAEFERMYGQAMLRAPELSLI